LRGKAKRADDTSDQRSVSEDPSHVNNPICRLASHFHSYHQMKRSR
jgi:hypothetical protein